MAVAPLDRDPVERFESHFGGSGTTRAREAACHRQAQAVSPMVLPPAADLYQVSACSSAGRREKE